MGKIKVLGVLGISFVAFISGCVLYITINSNIGLEGHLVNGTKMYDKWRTPTTPAFLKIYILNVTNSDVVMSGGTPNLVQLGPYVYQQERTKVGIVTDNDNDTISYQNQDFYFFRADLSTGLLSDPITVLNMPYLGIVHKSIQAGKSVRKEVSKILNERFPDENVYVKITVDKFLFGGYKVPFVAELSSLMGKELLPKNKFGFYFEKNGSDSLQYKIMAGVKEAEKFATIIAYDNKNSLELYEEEQCAKYNEIQGYDGAILPPFVNKEKKFYLFFPTLCNSVKFTFDLDVDFMGLQGYVFSASEHLNEEANNETFCLCTDDSKNCVKEGTLDLTHCKGLPFIMSFPHFYQADQEYLNQTKGLAPVKKVHQMNIVLEPQTGIALLVAIRYQMNFDLKPSKYFVPLKRISRMVHPIFWIDNGFTLQEEEIEIIKETIASQEIALVGAILGFSIWLLLTVPSVLYCIIKQRVGALMI